MFSRRHTFVVQVWEPGRSPVLENVRTHERVVLGDLSDVVPQIDRWLGEPVPGAMPPLDGGPPSSNGPAPAT
jgi:hypothetical protein